MSQEFRHIVRLAGRDLKGSQKIVAALAEIKGLGVNFANSLVNTLHLDPKSRLGYIQEPQVARIEEAIKDPSKFGIPVWALNRRKDLESGIDTHAVGSSLDFSVKTDIEREKNAGSWRGIRHAYGLKVRGQRTRTTGRKGRTMGVGKKAVLAAARAAEAAKTGKPQVGAASKPAPAPKEGAK